MKKKIAVLAMAMMLFAGVGSAFAQVAPDLSSGGAAGILQSGGLADTGIQGSKKAGLYKFEFMKAFQSELHQLNAMKTERLDIEKQIVQKKDNLIDLVIQAVDNKNKEALQEAAGIRKQIVSVKQEVKSLRQSVAMERKDFAAALKAKKMDEAKTHANRIIILQGEINGKLQDINTLLGQAVTVLGQGSINS